MTHGPHPGRLSRAEPLANPARADEGEHLMRTLRLSLAAMATVLLPLLRRSRPEAATKDVITRARDGLESGRTAHRIDDWFFENIVGTDLNIAVFGAGHVGSAVVRSLSALDCNIRWIDSRRGIFRNTPSNVRTIETPEPALEVAAMPPGSCYLVMTHSHAIDFDVCDRILRRPDAIYCGLIGSLSKRRRFEKRFRAQGLQDGRRPRLQGRPLVVVLALAAGCDGPNTAPSPDADAGVACNVLAGYHHDHLLVPHERVDTAGGKRKVGIVQDEPAVAPFGRAAVDHVARDDGKVRDRRGTDERRHLAAGRHGLVGTARPPRRGLDRQPAPPRVGGLAGATRPGIGQRIVGRYVHQQERRQDRLDPARLEVGDLALGAGVDAIQDRRAQRLPGGIVAFDNSGMMMDYLHAVPYLKGLGEAVGEQRRRLLDLLRKGDLDAAEAVFGDMEVIHDLLTSLDYPDGMTSGLRRTTDVARSLIERSRADLTSTVVQERLRTELADRQG